VRFTRLILGGLEHQLRLRSTRTVQRMAQLGIIEILACEEWKTKRNGFSRVVRIRNAAVALEK
jgi:hypothetical protein